MMAITNLIRSLVVGALILGLTACANQASHGAEGTARASLQSSEETKSPVRASLQSSREATDKAQGSLADIKFSFKLDPRITRGMYMGDRWVSPPTYTLVGQGNEATVEARAYGVDARQNPMNVHLEWEPSDPDMVTVSSSNEGRAVKIIVHKPGQSSLRVASGEFSKVLSVSATEKDKALQVNITQ